MMMRYLTWETFQIGTSRGLQAINLEQLDGEAVKKISGESTCLQ